VEISPVDTSTMTAGELREHIWTSMMRARVAAYPLPPVGHHPNFSGASEAASLLLHYLFDNDYLRAGMKVLSYPDYVLKPVRKGLLERGITVIVPAKYGKAYRLLEPDKVSAASASSIAGAEKEGLLIEVLPQFEMAFAACVALSLTGKALGKGYGFQLPTHLDIATATIVHPLQLVQDVPECTLRVAEFATPDKVQGF
jgi:5-formyltetrahydrofolate cyclo-ligase